jgi:hypothetical protein
MKAWMSRVAPFALVFALSGSAFAQQQPAPQPAPQPAAQVQAPPSPPSAPPSAPPPQQAQPQPAQPAPQGQQAPDGQPQPPQVVYQQEQEAPPPASQWVYSYPSGQWVFTSEYGWIWVPAGSTTTPEEGVPYTYLYTPTYGWNWYISPWGVGAYHYGLWVRHPWRPMGWRGGWVAGPRVFVHLGGHAGYRGRVVVHGGYGAGHPGHWGGGHRR